MLQVHLQQRWKLQQRKNRDFSKAFAQSWLITWEPFIIICLLTLILTPGNSHIKRMGVLIASVGVKEAPLRVFSLKGSAGGAFVLPFRVLTRKKIWHEIMCCFTIGTYCEWKRFQAMAQNRILVSLKGFFTKLHTSTHVPFYRGACPGSEKILISIFSGGLEGGGGGGRGERQREMMGILLCGP